jgi:nucleoside-diphosphate-sugar epimerase
MVGELTGTQLEPDYRPRRAGDVRDSLADIRAAREVLGYEPTVDVREGLRRTVDAFKKFTL